MLNDIYRRHRGSPALDDSFLPAAHRVHDDWNKSERRRLNTRRPTKTFELGQLKGRTRVTDHEHFYVCFIVKWMCQYDMITLVMAISYQMWAYKTASERVIMTNCTLWWYFQFSIPLLIKPGKHCPYIWIVCTGRPVYTARIYGCHLGHPYIWTMCTGDVFDTCTYQWYSSNWNLNSYWNDCYQ